MSDERDAARRFAVEHAGYTEDLPFWRAAASRTGSPVLDLGSATGRVAIPLARDGHEVCALDASPFMLEELGRRVATEDAAVRERIVPHRGDLAAPGLDRSFRLVLVAMNTLQVLLEPAARTACFAAMARHLAPEGELLFDVALPDVEEIRVGMGVERAGVAYRDPATGVRIAQSSWYTSFDPSTRTLGFTTRVRDESGPEAGRERLRRHTVHLYTRGEIAGLLDGAGLAAVGVYGGFSGQPLTHDSERQVYRCVHRAAAE